MNFKHKLYGTVAIPLILSGCGFPVAVQVASLVADGVSYAATEKTITDHGLSLVTDKDCAMWRAVTRDEICQDPEDTSGEFMVSDASDALSLQASEEALPAEEETESPGWDVADYEDDEADDDFDAITDDAVVIASLPEVSMPETVTAPETVAPPLVVTQVASSGLSEPKAPYKSRFKPVRKAQVQKAVHTVSQPISNSSGTYYVIASYHRAKDAKRFAKNQTRVDARILSGKAKGKSVYRVAVGPIEKPERIATRMKLVKFGYRDAWALKINKPKDIVEVASID